MQNFHAHSKITINYYYQLFSRSILKLEIRSSEWCDAGSLFHNSLVNLKKDHAEYSINHQTADSVSSESSGFLVDAATTLLSCCGPLLLLFEFRYSSQNNYSLSDGCTERFLELRLCVGASWTLCYEFLDSRPAPTGRWKVGNGIWNVAFSAATHSSTDQKLWIQNQAFWLGKRSKGNALPSAYRWIHPEAHRAIDRDNWSDALNCLLLRVFLGHNRAKRGQGPGRSQLAAARRINHWRSRSCCRTATPPPPRDVMELMISRPRSNPLKRLFILEMSRYSTEWGRSRVVKRRIKLFKN